MKRGLKWIGYILAGLLGLLALLVIVGLSRPEEMHVRASVEIDRPQTQVWEFLSNLENLPKWSSEVKQATKLSDNPRRYRITGMGGSSDTEFLSIEPPRRYVSKMEMPSMGFSGVWDIRVEPIGDRSKVSSEARIRMGNPLFRAMGLFMSADSAELATLMELKKYLETQPR